MNRIMAAAGGATLLLWLSSWSVAATPDGIGSPQRGIAYAQANCAGCHAILYEDTDSPNPDSPSFKSIADTPGITRTAISVFLQTPHPTMPNLVVTGEDADDIIAYILSLKGDGKLAPK
jgi:mono/diheme cytochrome c family protein